MKLRSLLSFLVVSSVLFVSCNQEDDFAGVPSPQEDATGYATIYLKDVPKSYSTRTASAEDSIESIEFYVFNSNDGSRDTKTGYLNPGIQNEYTFGVMAGNKTILVAVNMQLGSIDQANLATVRKHILAKSIDTPTSLPEAGIPMSGEGSVHVVEENVERVGITVSRLYSRLNTPDDTHAVPALTQKEIDRLNKETQGNFSTLTEFKLKRYFVVNGLNQSYVLPNYGPGVEEWEKWTGWAIGLEGNYTATAYDGEGELVKAYSGDDYLELDAAGVYVYENSPQIITQNSLSGYLPVSVYAYIIEAELSDGNESVTRYWRINLAKSTTLVGEDVAAYQVLRNSVYNLNIKNVKTAGYATPKDAEEEKPIIPVEGESGIEVTITVAEWREFEENTDI